MSPFLLGRGIPIEPFALSASGGIANRHVLPAVGGKWRERPKDYVSEDSHLFQTYDHGPARPKLDEAIA